MLDEIDSDASDDDFDGYIDEEDLCMREMEENGEVMKPKESKGDEMGNNNALWDNREGGGWMWTVMKVVDGCGQCV